MVPPVSDRVPPAPPYSGFGLGSVSVSRTGLSPATARLSRQVPLPRHSPCRPPYNPARASTPAVWALPLSLAATRGVTVVFLSSAYLDVSVRRVRHPSKGLSSLPLDGLPHSDTRGSSAVRASPRLFAACRVLLRLREPRHPPRALDYLSRASRPSRRHRGAGHLSILALYFFPSDCFLLSFHHVKDPSAPWEPEQGRGFRYLRASAALPRLSSRPARSPGQTRTADPHIISVVL